MTTLHLIRHGQTDWNAEYRLQGQKDIPINKTGRQQALANGKALQRALVDPAKFHFVSSPLARARETMEIVRRQIGLPTHGYEVDSRIQELTFGLWESYTFEELSIDHEGDVKLRHERKWDFVPPQGESYEMLLARVLTWLPYVEQDSVVVCHGGVLRVLMHHFNGDPKDDVVRFKVPHDRIFKWDGNEAAWME